MASSKGTPVDTDTGASDGAPSGAAGVGPAGEPRVNRVSTGADDQALPPRTERTSLWRGLPLAVSVLSLVVAVVSAAFAYQSSRDSYVSDRRSELISAVSQLSEASGDGELDEDTVFLIAHASLLVDTVPDVPAAVYRQIAQAIVEETPTYQEDALPLLDEAIARAGALGDEYEQVAALRTRARIYDAQGDLPAMRADYRSAIALSAEYDGPNLQRKHTVPAFTHVFWGMAEAGAGDCAQADAQLGLAREHAAVLTGSNLDAAIDGLSTAVDACEVDAP